MELPASVGLKFNSYSPLMLRSAASRTSIPAFKVGSQRQLVGGNRRWIQTNARHTRKFGQHGGHNGNTTALVVTAAVLGSCVAFAGTADIHNDAKVELEGGRVDPMLARGTEVRDGENLRSLVWGSNRRVR